MLLNLTLDLFKFKFLKQTPNENFEGLDLLTKLLTNPNNNKKYVSGKIEEAGDGKSF